MGVAHPGDGPLFRDRALAGRDVNPRQLDLFIDGGDAVLIHEIATGLITRDVQRTEADLGRLRRDYPDHPDLEALTALAEHIEMAKRRLVPAAQRILRGDASAFLGPMWQALAAAAAGLTFAPAHPHAHRAWLCQQSGDWPGVRTALEDEPGWADTPVLRYWMGLAQHHLGAPDLATRLWLPLCWMDPPLFEAHAPSLPDPELRVAWLAFQQALPSDEALVDRAPGTAWFPAWLLVRHPALSRRLRADDVPDSGDSARVFRQLLVLLPLEQGVLTDELVRQRRALQQLDGGFFRHYMAARGDRRSVR
jgi:hypothetical protein